MYMYGITFMSLSVTCDALIRELHLHHILTDTNTMHILNTLGFTTLASLRGIKKITLRKKGLSYGRANEIVNAVNHTQVNTLHMVVHKPMCPKKKRTHPPFRPKSSKIKPIRKLHSTHTSHVDKAYIDKVCKHMRWKPRVFLTYAWKKDALGRNTQQRIILLNDALRCSGKVETWLDRDCMGGTLTQSMCDGIDNCDIVLVCITRAYIDKCATSDNDNCKLELNYAYERKGAKRLIPIVMEEHCNAQKSWNGPVGAYLNKHVFISCISQTQMMQNIPQILDTIEKTMHRANHITSYHPTNAIDNRTIVRHWKLTSQLRKLQRSQSEKTICTE